MTNFQLDILEVEQVRIDTSPIKLHPCERTAIGADSYLNCPPLLLLIHYIFLNSSDCWLKIPSSILKMRLP